MCTNRRGILVLLGLVEVNCIIVSTVYTPKMYRLSVYSWRDLQDTGTTHLPDVSHPPPKTNQCGVLISFRPRHPWEWTRETSSYPCVGSRERIVFASAWNHRPRYTHELYSSPYVTHKCTNLSESTSLFRSNCNLYRTQFPSI